MSLKIVRKSFSATLTPSGNRLNWVIIRIPFDVTKVWGHRGQIRVKGEINGFPFHTSLFPSGDGRHFMIINKLMQKGGRAALGTEAQFRMEPDTENRVVPRAPEIDRVLKQSKRLQKFYLSLSPSVRKDIARFVSEPKHETARARRADQLAVRLMETMEAEVELPPIIRQVMLRNPPAEEGWRRMSSSHRRMHLLGIFYYRSFDARLRRIEKAVEEMKRYAK